MRTTRFFLIVILALTSCSKSTGTITVNDEHVNGFQSFQNIYGYVKGDWYKDHNPYVITGSITIGNGDTLRIHEGVRLVRCDNMYINSGGSLILIGTKVDPVFFGTSDSLPPYCGDNYADLFVYGSLSAQHSIIPGMIFGGPHDSTFNISITSSTMLNSAVDIDLRNLWITAQGAFDSTKNVVNAKLVINKSIFAFARDDFNFQRIFFTVGGMLRNINIQIDSNCIYPRLDTNYRSDELIKIRTDTGLVSGDSISGSHLRVAMPIFMKIDYSLGCSQNATDATMNCLYSIGDDDLRQVAGSPCLDYGAY